MNQFKRNDDVKLKENLEVIGMPNPISLRAGSVWAVLRVREEDAAVKVYDGSHLLYLPAKHFEKVA